MSAKEKEVLLENVEFLMNGLKEETRVILHLKYLQEYSIKEIQQLLGLSESAIKMRLKRARMMVVSQYQEQIMEMRA